MLQIDDDVMGVVRELARDESRLIGAVVSYLARRGLAPARVERSSGRLVIRAPAGAPATTPEMVRRALDED